MLLNELDAYFKGILPINELEKADSSANGIQVSRTNQIITKAAFAVDACIETFVQANRWGADLLFVHHGLFWGKVIPLTGIHFNRIKYLIDRDIALYAVHLPLDMHPEYGNNSGLARIIGCTEVEPFGLYKGFKIGFKGRLEKEMTIDEVLDKMGLSREDCPGVLPFGPEKIRTVGIISGAAVHEVAAALGENLDLYLTGEISHLVYHQCQEGKINMIAGGHYQTEVGGVKMLSEKLAEETDIKTVFLNIPTGF